MYAKLSSFGSQENLSSPSGPLDSLINSCLYFVNSICEWKSSQIGIKVSPTDQDCSGYLITAFKNGPPSSDQGQK